jgi:hypothetical protein
MMISIKLIDIIIYSTSPTISYIGGDGRWSVVIVSSQRGGLIKILDCCLVICNKVGIQNIYMLTNPKDSKYHLDEQTSGSFVCALSFLNLSTRASFLPFTVLLVNIFASNFTFDNSIIPLCLCLCPFAPLSHGLPSVLDFNLPE